MALWDAIIRVLIGATLITLGVELGGVFVIGTFVGIVLILTAITGFCPLYLLTGFSSEEEDKGEKTVW